MEPLLLAVKEASASGSLLSHFSTNFGERIGKESQQASKVRARNLTLINYE
jgi:hypothetical protein